MTPKLTLFQSRWADIIASAYSLQKECRLDGITRAHELGASNSSGAWTFRWIICNLLLQNITKMSMQTHFTSSQIWKYKGWLFTCSKIIQEILLHWQLKVFWQTSRPGQYGLNILLFITGISCFYLTFNFDFYFLGTLILSISSWFFFQWLDARQHLYPTPKLLTNPAQLRGRWVWSAHICLNRNISVVQVKCAPTHSPK